MKFTGPFGHRIKGGADGDALVFVLEIAAVLSIIVALCEYYGWLGITPQGTSVLFEPVGILVAILLATGVAFYFEYKAEQEFTLLNQVNDEETVVVIRGGEVHKIAKREVVVGDIILLSAGDAVPADAELLETHSLEVDESMLTGEPTCRKTASRLHANHDATFPPNHVMRGSKVVSGHGIARVFAVGDATESGHIFTAAQIDNSVRTPLDEQLSRLSHFITRASYSVAALVVVGRIIMFLTLQPVFQWPNFIAYLLQTLMIAVTLIVVAVPEGLPMAVTLSLAYSMRRMLRTNNLVRRMHACETMGAATVICTDKTGTLTQNRMEVADTFFCPQPNEIFPSEATRQIIAESIALNSTVMLDHTTIPATVVGNPTEGALLLWLQQQGFDYRDLRQQFDKTSELPFTTEKKYMATVVRLQQGGLRLYVKGAPEVVLEMCSQLPAGMAMSLIQSQLADYQSKAMRTLAFAYKDLTDAEEPFANNKVASHELTFLGFAAIADPIRADVPSAVAACRQAGIRIIMVTGDSLETAKEIALQTGLISDKQTDGNRFLTGPKFAAMSETEQLACAESLCIIARARPMDKRRLVEILQMKGEVVAVTGDGTNDAPALKLAHVGLSMGEGTSVAKEASDITILDNSFSTIGRAVMWGRSLYRNIQRFVLFQLTVNIVACIVVLMGAFTGLKSPLTVTQMLWVNLIMDTFAAVALAALPPSESVMKELPRRRTDFIINPPMLRNMLSVGAIFSIILLGLLLLFHEADISSLTSRIHLTGRAIFLQPYEMSLFFTAFVLLQFWNMFNARTFMTNQSALQLRGCKEFLLIATIIFVGQILIVECFDEVFSVTPLRLADWIILIAATSLVLWVGEIRRYLRRKALPNG